MSLRLFADERVCYREIKDSEDTVKLQDNLDHLECWAKSWGMRFRPVKFNININFKEFLQEQKLHSK